jgi:hypothetical protein
MEKRDFLFAISYWMGFPFLVGLCYVFRSDLDAIGLLPEEEFLPLVFVGTAGSLFFLGIVSLLGVQVRSGKLGRLGGLLSSKQLPMSQSQASLVSGIVLFGFSIFFSFGWSLVVMILAWSISGWYFSVELAKVFSLIPLVPLALLFFYAVYWGGVWRSSQQGVDKDRGDSKIGD